MYGEIVKVHGEDLTSGAVLVGGTMGALAANVFAESAVTITAAGESTTGATLTIKDSDTKDGTFAEVASYALPAGTYNEGDLITSFALPLNIKTWAKAEVSGATGVSVSVGYLPR